jgi:putative redox protein
MPVTTTIGRDHYTTEVHASGHALLADEPSAVGGADKGPSPYELLMAALGACTVITLRMYADRKEWPLDSVRCDLTFARIHARDVEGIDEEAGMVGHFKRIIALSGDLTDEHRTRLLEIANKCPVHRTLTSAIMVDTALA